MPNLALTPQQLAETAKNMRERATPASGRAVVDGPITSQTSNGEIRARAAQTAYAFAIPAHFVESILYLERRVAQLEEVARNSGAAHLASVEKR